MPRPGKLFARPWCTPPLIRSVRRSTSTAGSGCIRWYRTRSASLPGARLCYVVEWHSTVFLDGAQRFRHDGGYSPFEVDLGRLTPGSRHSIAVRVVVPDNSEHTPYPQGKQTSWYTDTGGIWQSVWLEQADLVRVRDLHVTPQLEFEGTEVISARIAVMWVPSTHRTPNCGCWSAPWSRHPRAVPAAAPAGFPAPRQPVVGEVIAEQVVRLRGGSTCATIEVPRPKL
jgi:hypothetical protein